jgi:hypothetical protein
MADVLTRLVPLTQPTQVAVVGTGHTKTARFRQRGVTPGFDSNPHPVHGHVGRSAATRGSCRKGMWQTRKQASCRMSPATTIEGIAGYIEWPPEVPAG